MPVADDCHLDEIVRCADIGVRAASQLRRKARGAPVGDLEALGAAKEFVAAAIAGGTFITTGAVESLQSSLKPLNWAADVYSQRAAARVEAGPHEIDYQKLQGFLVRIESVLDQLIQRNSPNPHDLEIGLNFFNSLGEILGTQADQLIRRTSAPFSEFAG